MGGTLALVQNGDRIRLDVPARKLELLVSDAELAARRKRWKAPRARKDDGRGYRKLFMEQITQADEGCDFTIFATRNHHTGPPQAMTQKKKTPGSDP